MAFSIMCMFLTVLYAGFAGLTFAFSKSVWEELLMEEREETAGAMRKPSNITNNAAHHQFVGGYNDGYIGERFDVRRPNNNVGGVGFVAPPNDASII